MAIGPDSLNYPPPRPGIGAFGPTTVTLPPPAGGGMVQPTGDGGAMVNFGAPESATPAIDTGPFNANLAEAIDEQELTTWSYDLLEGITTDLASRKDWEDDYIKGMKVLGLRIDETRNEPFAGACAARHPLLLECILRYQATAYAELLPAEGPCKTRVVGPSTEKLEEAAERVREAFNYFLTQTATEYEPDFDRMLFHKAAIGTTFKKVYTCPLLRRPTSPFLLPDDVIVNYNASSIETAARVTNRIHMRKSDLKRLQLKNWFRKVDLQRPTEEPSAIATQLAVLQGRTATWVSGKDDRHTLYETICERDVPGFEHKDERDRPTGLPLPWLVTLDKDSRRILRVQRFWREDDPDYHVREMYVKYDYVPGPGFYSLGLIHIVGNPQVAATMILRMLADSGMFRNFPAWLQSEIVEGDDGKTELRIGPGEGKTIKTGGAPIADVVMKMPFNEPSQMLAEILQMIVNSGERLGGTADLPVQEGRADAPVGTTLALIEQAMKISSAVHKRAHKSQAKEFRLLKAEFALQPELVWGYDTKDGMVGAATGEDFASVHILPSSDPNIPSHVQRMVRADALGRLQQEYPGELNRKATLRRRMSIMGFGDAEDLMNPDPPQAVPMDPASENIAVMQGAPLKADIHQDHLSHIPAHASLLMSPAAAANPQMVPALSAHIVEHFSLYYRMHVEAAIGQPLPPPGQPMPPELELRLSQEIAAVTQQLHEQMAKAAVGPFGADPAMVKMMENQVKLAQVQANAQKTEQSARSAEIDNRVQAASTQAEIAKHHDDLRNAAADRALAAREQDVKLADMANKERVAAINAHAKLIQAHTAKTKADMAARKAKQNGKAKR